MAGITRIISAYIYLKMKMKIKTKEQRANKMVKPIVHEIDDLNLSFRITMALKRNGIFTISAAKKMTEEDLLKLNGIGVTTARTVATLVRKVKHYE